MADLTDVREAVRAKMVQDATLTTLLGGADRVFHLRAKRPTVLPAVAFADSGTTPDATVPLHDRTVRIEAWATSAEQAEEILKRIRTLFARQPLPIPGTGWRFMGMYLVSDSEEPLEDGDVVGLPLVFRLLLYEIG